MNPNHDQLFSELANLYKESKAHQTLYTYSLDMLAQYSRQGDIIDVSPAAFLLLGYEKDEMIGDKLFEYCHPKDRERLEKVFEQDDPPKIMIYRMQRKKGDYVWLETRFNRAGDERPKRDQDLVGSSRDVTDQIKEKQKIEESEKRYRHLVEQSHETIGICRNEKWIFLNEAGLKLFGVVDLEEILGRTIYDFIHPKDQTFFEEQVSLLKQESNHSASFNIRFLRDDGKVRHVEMKWSSIIYGKDTAQQVFIQDVTKEKETEEILIRTEKLSVVGQLAASIAHEIRNPITSIKGFAQLIHPNIENENHKKYISIMLTELDRIENIVSDLLILSKKQVPTLEKTDFWPLIHHTTMLLNSEALMRGVEIVTNVATQLPPIECAPDQMKQVFINVLKNAIEASPKNGKVWIQADLQDKDHLRIQFVDEGDGISEERIEKLWQPFYTTKEKGTGLGLMICKRIVENHRGDINISSEANKGTRVTILLPLLYHGSKTK